jgi:hypothetical protein
MADSLIRFRQAIFNTAGGRAQWAGLTSDLAEDPELIQI